MAVAGVRGEWEVVAGGKRKRAKRKRLEDDSKTKTPQTRRGGAPQGHSQWACTTRSPVDQNASGFKCRLGLGLALGIKKHLALSLEIRA
jgi:hypothetical protein